MMQKMMNTIFRNIIMSDRLKKVGFKYEKRKYFRDGFVLEYYGTFWHATFNGKHYDIVLMKELYNLFWELTGKVLPNIDKV